MTKLTTREDILSEWADRLVSGRYPQGRQRLRRQAEDGDELFCCLGVLCEIAVEQGIIEAPTLRTQRDGAVVYVYGDSAIPSTTALPWDVRRWANVSELGDLTYPGNVEADTLAGANDRGMSFARIAELIRAGWVR